MINIAIFASGSGSNAERIITYFRNNSNVNFKFIITNKEDAYVRKRAELHDIPSLYYNSKQLKSGDFLLKILHETHIDWIILAGYLLLIPNEIIKTYPNRIINIHPALLPNYGGKGMYGMNVHKAVISNRETESGISIHYVNEKYDEGNIIFQAKCKIAETDDAESLAGKIHLLEHEHFPKVIESLIFN